MFIIFKQCDESTFNDFQFGLKKIVHCGLILKKKDRQLEHGQRSTIHQNNQKNNNPVIKITNEENEENEDEIFLINRQHNSTFSLTLFSLFFFLRTTILSKYSSPLYKTKKEKLNRKVVLTSGRA